MAGLKFDITGDNGNMLSALQGVQNGVRQTQRVVEQSGQGIEQVFSKVQSAAATAAGAFSAKELVRNVLEVRGQFQQLEVAFTTMLGSADKANDLMSQLVRTAATTPFDLKSVSEGAKQLLAYGTQADEVNGTLIRLGDIAAGLSIPLNDLVYLYGTTMTQGRMFTQDLRQFQGRGIPIADELAKIFGVTKDKVGELVTAGKVGAAEVQQAIENMTNAGSRFGGLMEAQSHTITGQISNIEDAIDSMFNDIGKANEGVINDALGGVSYLVEHWKEIGQIVLNVATAYGIAKAAVVAWSTYQKIHNLLMERAAVQMALAKAEGIALSEAEAMASVATMGFKNALNALKVAIVSNPVGALAVALTAVFTAMQLLDDETTELATASNKYGESAAKSIQKVKTLSDEVKGLSNSNKTITTSTKLSKDVLEELNQVLDESGVARIKEGDTIDTVNKKREMAISLIKEEAIERQRLNNIDAGNKEFDDKVNSANEQLRKDLANATFNSTGETILNKIFGSADEVREKSSAIFTVISQTIQENADLVANKTGSAYDKGLNEIYGKIRAKMEAMGVSKAALDKTWTDGGWLKQDNLVQKYIDSIQRATEAHYDYNKSVNAVAEAEKRAADKTLSFSDKVAGISRALQGPNDGVHQLYKNIQKLMEKYKKNTIGFEIQFSGKIPTWMDKIGIPQLSSLAKRFTSLGESLKKGQTMNVNGKTFTKEQLLQRGADYASAMEAKQKKIDAAKNNSENKGKSNPIAEQKKVLQEKLNALSYQEAAGHKGAELRRKINALAKKEKVYSSSYDTDNAKEAQRKAKEAADKEKKELNDAKKLQEKQAQANKEYNDAKIALEDSLEQSYVDSLVNGSEKTIKAMELAHKKELLEFEKQKQDYLNKKKKKSGGKNVSLDDNEAKKFDDIKSNILTKQENEKKDFYASQLQSMYDYLKQYGTIQEQAYAIAKEYDDKITKEKDENRKKILQKEKESALAKTNSNSLAMNIDWGATFGGIGNVLRDIAEETLKEVEQYMRSAEFKSLSPSDKKAYTDLRDKLRNEGVEETTSPFKFSQWGEIEEQTRLYQESVRNLKEKTEAHSKAVDDLKVAEKELSLATDKTTKSIAQSKVDTAQVEVKNTASEMNNAIADKDDKQANLTDSTSKAVHGLNNFSSALQTMSNGTLKGFADGLANLIKSIGGKGGAGGLIGAIGGKAGGLIGAILQIIDALGDDPGGFIKNILDRVGRIVETILAELPKLVEDILAGVLNIIEGIFNGIGRLFSGSGNEKDMEDEIKYLSKINERLAQSIDDLSKSIEKKDSTNKQAIDAYKKALKEELDWEKNQRNAIDDRASEWGKDHSFNYHASNSRWNIWGEFNKILEKIGSKARVYKATDVWKLSPEEMKELRAQAIVAWRYFFDSNQGQKSPEELVNQYIERAGKHDELTSTLNTKLTGYSWDGFMDSYKSTLKNLESTTEDFANNINEKISNALIESFTNEELKPKIKDLYNYIAKAAEDGLDNGEISYIKKKNDEIAALGLNKRSELEQAGLIKRKDSEQNATANGVTTITFEQASNIVALTTAGNISRDQTKELVTSIVSNLASLSSFSSSTSATIVEIRNLMITNNSYLEDILKNSKNIYNDFSSKIDDINRNLKELK